MKRALYEQLGVRAVFHQIRHFTFGGIQNTVRSYISLAAIYAAIKITG